MKQAKKQGESRQDLTTGETLALEIASLFPDEFRVWGDRVSVKENVGRESTRREVSANLAEMYAAADAERTKRNKGKVAAKTSIRKRRATKGDNFLDVT